MMDKIFLGIMVCTALAIIVFAVVNAWKAHKKMQKIKKEMKDE